MGKADCPDITGDVVGKGETAPEAAHRVFNEVGHIIEEIRYLLTYLGRQVLRRLQKAADIEFHS